MKKTHSKLKVLLGVLSMTAFIFGFAACGSSLGDLANLFGNGNKEETEQKLEELLTPVKSELGYFTAVGTTEGLKITIADNVEFMKDAGCVITVEDNPFLISITGDDVDKNRKEFIFPFTKAGLEYNIIMKANIFIDGSKKEEWKEDSAKCRALGGIDYSKLIDTKKFADSTLDINFDKVNNFTAVYDIDINSIDNLIKDKSAFESAGIDFTVLLGKPNWSNTKWFGNLHIDFLDEDVNDLIKISKSGFAISTDDPFENEWERYEYEYNCYAVPSFIFKKYPNTRFEINRIETKLKTYVSEQASEQSSELVIFDPATAEVTKGEIVNVDGTAYWKVTVDGYGTFINVPEVNCKGKTLFKTTMFAEKDDETIKLTLKLADSEFNNVSTPSMEPTVSTPKEYTAPHAVKEDWNTISETDIISIVQPIAQDNKEWKGADGVVVYIGKITAVDNNSVTDNSFKINYFENSQYTAAIFSVEEDWESITVIFADDTNFDNIQFNVICDTILSEEDWGTAYYTTYPKIFQAENTINLTEELEVLKKECNNPKTKLTKLQIQNKIENDNAYTVNVVSAKVTKTDGTSVFVKPKGDWGSTVE